MAEWDNTKLKETVSIGIHLSRTQPSLLTNTTINSEALAESLELAVHFLLPSLYSYTYPFTFTLAMQMFSGSKTTLENSSPGSHLVYLPKRLM